MLHTSFAGRTLLQESSSGQDHSFDSIQWPSAGHSFDQDFFGRCVKSVADIETSRHVDSDTFMSTVSGQVQLSYPMSEGWNVMMCDLHDRSAGLSLPAARLCQLHR